MSYDMGVKHTDPKMANLNIESDLWHPDRNHNIKPNRPDEVEFLSRLSPRERARFRRPHKIGVQVMRGADPSGGRVA